MRKEKKDKEECKPLDGLTFLKTKDGCPRLIVWRSSLVRRITRSTYLCVHILVSQREHELEYLKKNSRKYLANREINSIPFSASIIVIAGDAPARRPRIAFIVDRRRIRSIVSHDRENTRWMGVGKNDGYMKITGQCSENTPSKLVSHSRQANWVRRHRVTIVKGASNRG